MPSVLAWLIGGLVASAGTLVGKVLISLGIAFVTYNGVDVALAFVRTRFVAEMGALPAVTLSMLGVLKVGVVFSILMSAVVARMTLQGLQSGAITKMVNKT